MKCSKPSRALLVFSAMVTCIALPGAVVLWFRGHEKAFATSLFLLGLSLGPCFALYAFAPHRHKQTMRRLVLFAGGLSIIAFSVLGAASMDLEGFFMLLFLGTMGAAVGHTLVTLILGPVFFGRFLCGWGCWRAMVLEVLPIRSTPGRRTGVWSILAFLGLALSIASAAVSVFLLGHRPGGTPGTFHSGSVRVIVISFAVYYVLSIGLAVTLRDRRAFCKYLCPSGAILGVTSRLSILKMHADARLCNDCGACSQICPMDIDVAHFARLGQRVLSGQCILCQRCAHACPTGALQLSAAFDLAGTTPFVVRKRGVIVN